MLWEGYYVLCANPLILSFIADYTPGGSPIPPLAPWMQPAAILEHVPWWCAKRKMIEARKADQGRHLANGIDHHLIVNTEDEEEMRTECSAQGGRFPLFLYSDEDIFRPMPVPKIYDAVYIAKLCAFKRHALARMIPRIYVVSYGGDLKGFCPELAHAYHNEQHLPPHAVARKINEAHVGLCLSEIEGPMIATVEYLLCGIPIVTTPSKGGRDDLFDEGNSLMVDPDPSAVSAAVRRWIETPPDGNAIRSGTLDRLRKIRMGYCRYLSRLIDQLAGRIVDPEALYKSYFDRPGAMPARFVHKIDYDKVPDLRRFDA